jgi:Putative beta-barrel porin 2
VACAIVFVARTAAAGEYAYALSYSADHSDNIGLTPTDTKSELIHTVSGSFTLNQIDRALDARAHGSVTYQDYQHNTFADQTTLGLDAAVLWKPLPESLHWAATDVYTQLAANPTQANTPANRVNANVFSTGPDIIWRVDPVNTVQLGARYVNNTFSGTDNATLGTDADNNRKNASIQWSYRYSPVTTLSLAHLTESVRFDQPGVGTNFDFRTNQTTASLVNRRDTNTFSVDVGASRVDREGQPEIHGNLGRLSWTRQLSSDSTFSLSAARSLSDAAGELLAGSGTTGPVGAPLGISTSDIFTARTVTLLYSRRFGAGTLTFSGFRVERVFELSTADNDDARGGSLQWARTFSERVTGVASFLYVKTLFPTIVREDRDSTEAVSLQYRFTRQLVGGISVAHRSLDSTDPTADFKENRIVLSLVYNSLPMRW